MRTSIVVTAIVGSSLIGGSVALLATADGFTTKRPKRFESREERAAAERLPTTVVHRHVVTVDPKPESSDAKTATVGTAQTSETAVSHEQALFELRQRAEAAPENGALQARNEQVLKRMLARVAAGKSLRTNDFFCRGPSCIVVFDFENLEQARATLNVLPNDEEWLEYGFGFNALPTEPGPEATRFVVHFMTSRDLPANP
jgi:hypothetical protein